MKDIWNEFWNTKDGAMRVFKGLLTMVSDLMRFGVIPIPAGWAGVVPIILASTLGVALPAGDVNNPKNNDNGKLSVGALLIFITVGVGFSMLMHGCAANFANKPRAELAINESLTRQVVLIGVRAGARYECASQLPATRAYIQTAITPLRDAVNEKDYPAVVGWFADAATRPLDDQARVLLYPVVADALDALEPCKLLPDSLECKNMWTNLYGEMVTEAVNSCFFGLSHPLR